MANSIVDRRRIVQRGVDSTGKGTVNLTQWNLVTFSDSGEMLEPVSTDIGVSSFNDANFPVHGFHVLDIGDRMLRGVTRSAINMLPS